MGDRVNCTFQIGGKVPAEAMEDFRLGLEEYVGDGEIDFALEQILDGDELYLEEINYANLDAITKVCEKHGLSYIHTWTRGEDFNSAIALYDPDVGYRDIATNCDGEAVLSAREIKNLQLNSTWAIFAYLDQFDNPKVPDVTLATDAEEVQP